jgi:hypothetical protein
MKLKYNKRKSNISMLNDEIEKKNQFDKKLEKIVI